MKNLSWLVWLSRLEHHPVNQKVADSIADQIHAWVAGSIPNLDVCRRQRVDASLSLPAPPLSSENKE